MALTTRHIAPDSDPKLKKLKFSIRIIPEMNFGSGEFRVIDSSMKSAAAISRGRVPADGGRAARHGAALAGGGGRAPTPERQHRAPTTP